MTGPLKGVLRPFQQFVATASAGGLVLLACAVLALAWANSPWAASYFDLWHTSLSIQFGARWVTASLQHVINDGLMVVFFFLVGLEIKRELLVGELASVRQAALPIAAAIGGMALPALFYLAVNARHEGAAGWAIPVATDIAFALGVLALLGSRIPPALKVFLTALAIVDDMGAVAIIAVFYSKGVSWAALAVAATTVAVLFTLARLGVRRLAPYLIVGVVLWMAVLASGIHATIAGVVLAMTIPARTRIDEDEFIERSHTAWSDFVEASSPLQRVVANPAQQEALHSMGRAVADVQSPLMKLEHSLHGPVAFAIMPLFALANAGVTLNAAMWQAINWRVFGGIVLGLLLGKAVGIAAATFVATKSGLAAPMHDVSQRAVFGVSWLGGIGFTMALFIASLAFPGGPLLDSAKIGILTASVVAGTVGWMLLRTLPVPPATDKPARILAFPSRASPENGSGAAG